MREGEGERGMGVREKEKEKERERERESKRVQVVNLDLKPYLLDGFVKVGLKVCLAVGWEAGNV